MIDWMNPSDDVIEAKRIGYEEGCREQAERAEDAESEAATLAGQVLELQTDLERVRRTSDGIPLYPKQRVWCAVGIGRLEVAGPYEVLCIGHYGAYVKQSETVQIIVRYQDLFSTQAAAQAAIEARKGEPSCRQNS